LLWKKRFEVELINSSAFFLGPEKFLLAVYIGGVYGFVQKINKE